MIPMKLIRTAALIVMLLPLSARADIIHVPADQPTIQAGIDAAVDGDTVLVADGTYTGDGNRDIDFNGKAITVKSENGAENCIIDCEGSGTEPHRGFFFHSFEGSDSTVMGFTIQSGYVSGVDPQFHGGGILCWGSAPTIIDNVFINNYGGGYGGAVMCTEGSPALISGNTFTGNEAGNGGGIACEFHSHAIIIHNSIIANVAGSGGGIYCHSSAIIVDNMISENTGTYECGGITCGYNAATIADNIIIDNSGVQGGGIFAKSYATPIVSNNIIAGNSAGAGGGIYIERSSPTITNCTIYENNTSTLGGGICCILNSHPTVADTILWNNDGGLGDQIYVGKDGHPSDLVISYSDIQGGPGAVYVAPGCSFIVGDGMTTEDPLFVPGPMGDYYLSQIAAGQEDDSPCIDAGSALAKELHFTTGEGDVCLDELTSRTDLLRDTGQADIGYHYDWHTVSAQLECLPCSGTVPFSTHVLARLNNVSPVSSRIVRAHIDVATAGGTVIPNWKSGQFVLSPGESRTAHFIQTIPDYPLFFDTNTFTLVAERPGPPTEDRSALPVAGVYDIDRSTVTGFSAVVVHVPEDQPTIQAGIDAAPPGATVLVADGTYTGDGNRDLDFNGKAITVASENGPQNCIIDCEGSESNEHRGFYFHSNEGPDSILRGFTIRNGFISYPLNSGGGILCEGASPTITGNIITENTAEDDIGGGICFYGGSPIITGNTIRGNTSKYGGGIYCIASWGIIDGNVISNNVATSAGGGVSCDNVAYVTLSNNVISGNYTDGPGGGIYVYRASPVFINNIISDNLADGTGGGIYISFDESYPKISHCTIAGNQSTASGGGLHIRGSFVDVDNTIFWGNDAPFGKEIYILFYDIASVLTISYSDIEEGKASVYVDPGCILNWGPGMIEADPIFVTGPTGDYYLSQVAAGQSEDSPCLDVGSDLAENICIEIPEGEVCLDELTTRTDHLTDSGQVDMGYHYDPDEAD